MFNYSHYCKYQIKNGKVIKKYVGFSRLINEYEDFI
jgi:hypothetical protein